MELPQPSPLSRMNTTMSPNQTNELTCVPHMISRLFIRNIFKLPGMLNSECNQFLNTYEFNQIGEIGSDISVEDVSLPQLVTHCKNVESVHKVVMYLYIYFLIIEKYPTICSVGLIDTPVSEIIDYVKNQINAKLIPKKVEQYESVIIPVLEKIGQINISVEVENMNDKKVLSRKFIRHMKRHDNEYVGCLMYSDEAKHATVIGGIGYNPELSEIPVDNTLIIKDSYGVSNTYISIHDFLNHGFNGYELKYFVYLSPTMGGKSRKKLNKKTYRKHKR